MKNKMLSILLLLAILLQTLPVQALATGYDATGVLQAGVPVEIDNVFYDATTGNVTGVGVVPNGQMVIIQSVANGHDVTVIEEYAFWGASDLVKISIPKSIVQIESYAFEDCESLRDVYFTGSRDEWNAIRFGEGNDLLFSESVTIHCKDELGNIVFEHSVYTVEEGEDIILSATVPDADAEYQFTWRALQSGIVSLSNNAVTSRNNLCMASIKCHGVSVGSVNVILNLADGRSASCEIRVIEKKIQYRSPIQKNGTFKFMSDILEGGDIEYGYSYDESWFLSDSSFYQHSLVKMSIRAAMSAFGAKDTTTNQEARAKNIRLLMADLGFNYFDDHYVPPKTDAVDTEDNSIGFAIGSKNIQDSSGQHFALLMVAVRGGGYFVEWGDNFNVGTGMEHAGFAGAARKVLKGIQEYLNKYEEHLDSNIKVWIMGYSRGAATTNIVAKNLNDGAISGIQKKNVYAFCFECPQNTRMPASTREDNRYNNIVSIVNPIDFVPKVAMSDWGFGRYGKTYFTPYHAGLINWKYSKLEKRMKANYSALVDHYPKKSSAAEDLIPDALLQAPKLDLLMKILAHELDSPSTYTKLYQVNMIKLVGMALGKGYVSGRPNIVREILEEMAKIGVISVAAYAALFYRGDLSDLADAGLAHYSELCLSWLDALEGEYEYASSKYRLMFVNCPIDVEIYDSGGALVGKISDDVIIDIEGGVVSYIDSNGQKVIALPIEEQYTINMTATAQGEVTYTATCVDMENGLTEQVVSYQDIPIKSGDELVGIAENLENLQDNATAEYPLIKDDEQLVADVSVSGNEVHEYAVSVESSGNGSVIGNGRFVEGEYAKVTASPNNGEDFLGWYINHSLVSTDNEYRFLVDKDISLSAKFTSHYCSIFDMSVRDGIAKIEIIGNDNFEAMLCLAQYSSEGQFLNITLQNVTGAGSFELNIPTEDAGEVSAYILDTVTYQPICEKFSRVIL